jgi:hypothetical protein
VTRMRATPTEANRDGVRPRNVERRHHLRHTDCWQSWLNRLDVDALGQPRWLAGWLPRALRGSVLSLFRRQTCNRVGRTRRDTPLFGGSNQPLAGFGYATPMTVCAVSQGRSASDANPRRLWRLRDRRERRAFGVTSIALRERRLRTCSPRGCGHGRPQHLRDLLCDRSDRVRPCRRCHRKALDERSHQSTATAALFVKPFLTKGLMTKPVQHVLVNVWSYWLHEVHGTESSCRASQKRHWRPSNCRRCERTIASRLPLDLDS